MVRIAQQKHVLLFPCSSKLFTPSKPHWQQGSCLPACQLAQQLQLPSFSTVCPAVLPFLTCTLAGQITKLDRCDWCLDFLWVCLVAFLVLRNSSTTQGTAHSCPAAPAPINTTASPYASPTPLPWMWLQPLAATSHQAPAASGSAVTGVRAAAHARTASLVSDTVARLHAAIAAAKDTLLPSPLPQYGPQFPPQACWVNENALSTRQQQPPPQQPAVQDQAVLHPLLLSEQVALEEPEDTPEQEAEAFVQRVQQKQPPRAARMPAHKVEQLPAAAPAANTTCTWNERPWVPAPAAPAAPAEEQQCPITPFWQLAPAGPVSSLLAACDCSCASASDAQRLWATARRLEAAASTPAKEKVFSVRQAMKVVA